MSATDAAAAAPPDDANPTEDGRWMDHALGLAARALGTAAPNPAVGCVIVQPRPGGKARVVGRGWTGVGGRPHAETVALAKAGTAAAGATAYVTLEPCSHTGRTGPCAHALAEAGIRRVVAALADPDERVDGRGFRALSDAGIAVTIGVRAAAAARLNAGFLATRRRHRPLIALKVAASLDGRIATANRESRWITGEAARDHGHRLRATHDAILIGGRTAILDNPLLTCRLPGLSDRSPVRIVVDRHLRLPLTARLIATAREVPTWVVALHDGTDAERRRTLVDCGVELIEVAERAPGEPDLAQMAALLARRGLTRVLVEGGARMSALLLAEDLIDRIYWFRSGGILGGDALGAVAALGIDDPNHQIAFDRRETRPIGPDALDVLDRVGGAVDAP